MDELGNTPGVRGNPGWKRCVAGGSSTTIGRPQGHLIGPRKLEAVIDVWRAISNSFPKRPRLVFEGCLDLTAAQTKGTVRIVTVANDPVAGISGYA
jgi:hypothetical protein